jgi:hypothetical protein
MATTRIKDITTAATTFSSDDFVAIDGATSGTRKMAKDDLITEVSSGVSGTYLEESNNLSDVDSLDTSKLNMEIPDVGSAGNQAPLNSMLSSMAYQDSSAISVGQAEIETLEVTDKVDGNLGINTTASSTHALDVFGSVNCSSAVYAADVVVNGTTPTVTLNDTDGDANAATAYVQFQQGGTGIGKIGDIASGRSAMMVTSDSGKELMFFTDGQNASSATPAVTVDTSQRVGIGGSPSYDLHVTNASTAASIGITGTGGSKDTWTVTSSDSGGKALLNFKDEDTANTVMRLHQDGQVGIGNSSPGSYYSESDDLVIGDVSGDRGITVVSGTSGTGSLFFADGTSGADAYRGQIRYLHNANQLMFAVNSNEAFRVGSGGDIVMASGNGIDFGATVLSEFEQGIFTASVAPATSGTLTIDTASDQLAYAIVGDIVTVHGQIALDGASSPVGNYVKINLPAAIALGTLSEDADYSAGSCVVTSAAGNLGDYSLLAVGGDSFVRIYKNTASTFGATAADFNGDESIYISITYRKG